jgi:hypothetical protein
MSVTLGKSPKLDTVRTRAGLQVLGKNQAVRLLVRPDPPTTRDRFVTEKDLRNLWRGARNTFLIVTPFWVALIWWLTR